MSEAFAVCSLAMGGPQWRHQDVMRGSLGAWHMRASVQLPSEKIVSAAACSSASSEIVKSRIIPSISSSSFIVYSKDMEATIRGGMIGQRPPNRRQVDFGDTNSTPISIWILARRLNSFCDPGHTRGECRNRRV